MVKYCDGTYTYEHIEFSQYNDGDISLKCLNCQDILYLENPENLSIASYEAEINYFINKHKLCFNDDMAIGITPMPTNISKTIYCSDCGKSLSSVKFSKIIKNDKIKIICKSCCRKYQSYNHILDYIYAGTYWVIILDDNSMICVNDSINFLSKIGLKIRQTEIIQPNMKNTHESFKRVFLITNE